MLAIYPGDGARYARHFDSMAEGKGSNGRVLTCMLYLNPFWSEFDGGQLRLLHGLHDEGPENILADVAPVHGRLAVFLCESRCPHEVLPSLYERVSVTIWYYNSVRLQKRCQSELTGYG